VAWFKVTNSIFDVLNPSLSPKGIFNMPLQKGKRGDFQAFQKVLPKLKWKMNHPFYYHKNKINTETQRHGEYI
jgi:hypothetical protein